MPENRWISTSSTVYSVGANWSLGAKPAPNDDVVVGAGTASMLSGFDADGAAIAVRSFHRHPLYTGNTGTSGDPLVLATGGADAPYDTLSSAGKVIVQGPGEFYYVNGTGGIGQTTNAIYIDTDTQDTAIELAGTIVNLFALKGRIVGLSTFGSTLMAIAYRNNPATDVHFTMQQTGGTFSMEQAGGTVINTGTAAIANLTLNNGTFDHGTNGGAITSLRQTGGLLIHRSAATTTQLFVHGGTADYSQDPRAKTISNLRLFPFAVFMPNAHTTITAGGELTPITVLSPGRSF